MSFSWRLSSRWSGSQCEQNRGVPFLSSCFSRAWFSLLLFMALGNPWRRESEGRKGTSPAVQFWLFRGATPTGIKQCKTIRAWLWLQVKQDPALLPGKHRLGWKDGTTSTEERRENSDMEDGQLVKKYRPFKVWSKAHIESVTLMTEVKELWIKLKKALLSFPKLEFSTCGL